MAYSMKPIALTASATLSFETHGEGVVKCDAAAGMTVTLPSTTGSGGSFLIFFGTTVTSNDYIVQVTTTDIFSGGVSMSTDIAGTNLLTAATTDTITMDGAEKGGLIGSWLRVTDVAAGVWALEGFLKTTGVEATPFSAAVS